MSLMPEIDFDSWTSSWTAKSPSPMNGLPVFDDKEYDDGDHPKEKD